MYETPEQKEPVFDAKGVETVRRDTCAAVSKVRSSLCSPLTTNDTVVDDCDERSCIDGEFVTLQMLEKSVKILFNSRDVSLVKSYVQKQCTKLLQGKISIQDCVFAKEYRGIGGYKPGACVPALSIAR